MQDSQALLENAMKLGLRPDLDSQKAPILRETQTLDPERIIAALASAGSLGLSTEALVMVPVLCDTACALEVRLVSLCHCTSSFPAGSSCLLLAAAVLLRCDLVCGYREFVRAACTVSSLSLLLLCLVPNLLLLQVCSFTSMLDVLDALQQLYGAAVEPACEAAYAEAQLLEPVLAAACLRSLALLGSPQQQHQVSSAQCTAHVL